MSLLECVRADIAQAKAEPLRTAWAALVMASSIAVVIWFAPEIWRTVEGTTGELLQFTHPLPEGD